MLALALLLFQSPAAAQYDELLRRHAARGWSGAVLVARDGQPLFLGGYGFADFEAGRANDGDTLFEIASLTKSFTAVAVVRLAQQEKLALDEALPVHLPGVPEHSQTITLRQLLAHTSGIPRDHTRGTGDDLTKALIGYLGDGPVREPGSRFEYWNGGYALLAGVIERASGLSYGDYLERELFAPAGMPTSGFTGDRDLDAQRLALGHAQNGRDRRADEPPYGAYDFRYKGMGGLVTSARELLAFDRALDGTQLLDDAHRKELFTPQRDAYALGWYIGRAADGSPRQSHGGDVRGFGCEFRRYPQQDACLAVLCNQDDARAWELADELEKCLLGRGKPAASGKEVLTAAEESACAGTYSSEQGRIVVRAAPGVLWAGVEGAALLTRLGADAALAWEAGRDELKRAALEIIEGIAHGDVEPLRARMARSIPVHWPEVMKSSIWPAQLERHGAYRAAFPLGVRAHDDRLEVLVAVEHERGTHHALLAFGPAGLEILDWQGPTFLAAGRLERQKRGTFELRLGQEPVRLEFVLAGSQARELRLGGFKLARQ